MTVPLITEFTGTSPNRNTQDSTTFTLNSIEWLDYQLVQISETNTSITEINNTSTTINNDALAAANSAAAALVSEDAAAVSATTSQSNANFKGRWSDATGAATVPSSYSNNGQTWQLLQNIADITADEPVAGAANWQVVNDVNMANVRLSKLNNPITHLFKKNNLVEVLNGSMSVARSTIATYVDRHGIVRTAAIDIPREEKDGWLIEGASTNLCLQSESFLTSPWVQSIYNGGAFDRWTVTEGTGDITDIYGTTNLASKFVATATPDPSFAIQAITMADATDFSTSVYIYVPTQGGISDYDIRAAYDTDVTDLIDITTFDRWVKLSLTKLTTAARTTFTLQIRPNGVTAVAGFTFYSMSTQLEELPFATSYIPTTTTSETRAADVISIDVAENFLSSAEGDHSQYLKFSLLGDTADNQTLFNSKSAGANNNRFMALLLSSSGAVIYRDSSLNQSNSPDNTFGDIHSIALITESNNVKSFSDNVAGTITAITPDDSLDLNGTLIFGSDDAGADRMYGHIQDFRSYDFALNIDEIKLLGGE